MEDRIWVQDTLKRETHYEYDFINPFISCSSWSINICKSPMSQNIRKWKCYSYRKSLCRIWTPLAWLLGGVLHAKGNDDLPNSWWNSTYWPKWFLLSLPCMKRCPRLYLLRCSKYNIVWTSMLKDKPLSVEEMSGKKQDVFKVNEINKNNGRRKA